MHAPFYLGFTFYLCFYPFYLFGDTGENHGNQVR